MTLEHNIRYDQRYDTLTVVYKLGSFTAAGAELALTPSAVAQQIHSIEQELDAVLFNKNGNRLIPTRECELIAGYVSQIHMICHRMDDDLSANGKKPHRLVIGATPSVEGSALSRVISGYEGDANALQITVKSACAAELHSMLASGAIDLAVVEGDFPTNDFNFILLDTDYLVVAVPKGGKYADAREITLKELEGERLILRPRNSGTRSLFEAHIGKLGLSLSNFHVMMEIESVETIKKLVSENYGVSILSNKACTQDVAQGRFKTLSIEGVSMVRNIRIFYRRDFKYDDILLKIQDLYSGIMREDS